jgi:type IV secretion system protein VirB11
MMTLLSQNSASSQSGVIGMLAPLQDFLDDERVSELFINKPQEVFVERDGRMIRFDLPVLTPKYLHRLFGLMANENNQVLSEKQPLLSGNLPDGSRIQLCLPPVTIHETLSIRKFVVNNLSFQDYEHQGFFESVQATDLQNDPTEPTDDILCALYHEKKWSDFIQQAIRLKKNMVICGGTGLGKTTFLNTCVGCIPLHERVILLEDTYEIKVNHPNIVRLKTVKNTAHHQTNVTMQTLVQTSLRLRPDRLIMGEIRGQEIFDFVSACSTGHEGSIVTLHANNPKSAFMRMAQLYKLNNVPSMTDADIARELHDIIDVVVQLGRFNTQRRLTQVYYKHAFKGLNHAS